MPDLGQMKCKPCSKQTPRLEGGKLEEMRRQVQDWDLVDGHHLTKAFRFPDFAAALEFVNKIGQVAEDEGHHPRICFTYGRVEVELYTHAIDGLSENDFILAAKIDELPRLHE